MKKLVLLLFIIMLSGCAGRDPEKRDYAVGLFIHGGGKISVGTAKLSKNGDESMENIFYGGEGDDLAAALDNARKNTGDNLYFGHLRFCVIDEKAINEKNIKELSALFTDDDALAGNVWVMAAENAAAIEKAAEEGFDIAAFAEKYYGENGKYAKQKRSIDINRLLYTLGRTNGSAEIPLVKAESGGLKMAGGIITENYRCTEKRSDF
ncbi:MAG: hypothetical protein IJR59_00560 [Firmicutes bacterium]|nr:hypothetical protein [Bacillota bacterium]